MHFDFQDLKKENAIVVVCTSPYESIGGQIKLYNKYVRVLCWNAIASAQLMTSVDRFDVIIQNNESSLHDFKPLFSSGFRSLIASDSLKDKASQLFDESMTFVFSRTAFTWNCIGSTTSPHIWNRSTRCFHPLHSWKCLLIALSFWLQPCCFVRLNRVLSVLPM